MWCATVQNLVYCTVLPGGDEEFPLVLLYRTAVVLWWLASAASQPEKSVLWWLASAASQPEKSHVLEKIVGISSTEVAFFYY